MEEKRYLGLDYGGRRIGVALSDPGAIIAQPLETITVTGVTDAVGKVCRVIAEHGVIAVIIGLPLSLSGRESETTAEVRKFAERLGAACPVPIHFEDERLSSRQAEMILHSHGKKIKGNKGKIDRISAAVILQSYLDRLNISSGSG
jgi:putative holliday junction resolvase